MAQRIYDAYGCDGASDYGQHLPDEVVEGGVVLLIDDIDWLDLSHKHGLLGSIVAEGPPRTN